MTDPSAGVQVAETTEGKQHFSDEQTDRQRDFEGRSPLRIAFGRLAKDKVAMACAVVVLFFVLIAIFAPWISSALGVSTDVVRSCDVLECNAANPGVGYPKTGPPFYGYDPEHPFGIAPRTGADNLAHWLEGCRTSLLIAGTATLLSSVFGILMGLIAGFAGGAVDKVISFVIDFFLTIPFLLAALTIAPIIIERYSTGDSYATAQKVSLIGVLAVFGWMGVARLIRGEVLSLREREFILAARVIGMPTRRIMLRELLPNLTAPIVISVSLALPAFVAAEAGLAFLGIGVSGSPSWGQTISKAVPYWSNYSLYLLEPMLGVVLLVLALNLLGDAIRDALDPKTRR
ncbi:ABC transporter permease [Nocardioides sp. HM23]|uniref:ABC transporter permease n=1 Tax=Nocardioides bizhenqiangii TaxID=3095076 RepID=UPI002ACA876F|nr:ABC transporter permease [Nocardioides sp. HM23]MDZ5622211.1 ABC transporter permease [Nocardioides sp. HM23]